MKRLLTFVLVSFFSVVVASPVTLQGKVNSNVTNLRLGAFWVDRNQSNNEIISTNVGQNGFFSLTIPEKSPIQSIMLPLTRENFNLPGILGSFTLNTNSLFCQIKLFIYSDDDFSNNYSNSDKIFDTFASLDRGNMQIIWLQKATTVQGKGFSFDLPTGISILLTEFSRNQSKISVVNQVSGIQVEIFI